MSSQSYATCIWEWSLFAGKVTFGIISLVGLLLYTNQDRLLYIPNPPGFPQKPSDNPSPFRNPGEWTVKGRRSVGIDNIPFEEENLPTADGKFIHTWLMLQPNSANSPTLIYFHGNAGNMGLRLKNAAMMYAKCGINILMMDYRGFGSSTGVPNELGLNLDAVTVMEYAKNHPKLKNSHLIAFGRSLGGAVAISLAEKYPEIIKAVIVENTFLSVGAMVDVLMPFLSPFKKLVLCIGWNSDEKIAVLKQPILLISGDSDELVPPSHMRKLRDYATKSRNLEFYSVSGGGHNDTFERAGLSYYERLLSFLQKSFPDFKENCRDNVNENQTCYSNEDVYVIPTNDNNGNNNNLKEIGHESDDISFDNAEYINNLKDPNDDDKNFDDLKSALPTMRSDFRKGKEHQSLSFFSSFYQKSHY